MKKKENQDKKDATAMAMYIGVKQVQAHRMNKLEAWNKSLVRRDKDSEVTKSELQEMAKVEGYKVIYPDGYESWSPADVFEKAYRKTGNLTFGMAVESLKRGDVIRRMFWPQSLFLQLKPGYPVDEHILPKFGDKKVKTKEKKEFNGHLNDYIVSAEVFADPLIQGKFSVDFRPWVPNFADVLADDWMVMPKLKEKKE